MILSLSKREKRGNNIFPFHIRFQGGFLVLTGVLAPLDKILYTPLINSQFNKQYSGKFNIKTVTLKKLLVVFLFYKPIPILENIQKIYIVSNINVILDDLDALNLNDGHWIEV